MKRYYDITDPFQEFVSRKYANSRGPRYNYFAREWDFNCGCCGEPLNAPNRKTMIKIRLYHTRNECLGGY